MLNIVVTFYDLAILTEDYQRGTQIYLYLAIYNKKASFFTSIDSIKKNKYISHSPTAK